VGQAALGEPVQAVNRVLFRPHRARRRTRQSFLRTRRTSSHSSAADCQAHSMDRDPLSTAPRPRSHGNPVRDAALRQGRACLPRAWIINATEGPPVPLTTIVAATIAANFGAGLPDIARDRTASFKAAPSPCRQRCHDRIRSMMLPRAP
jgi:hypothetical protein